MKTILGALTIASVVLLIVAMANAAGGACSSDIPDDACVALHRELHEIFPDAGGTSFGIRLLDRSGGFWSLQVRSHPSLGFNPLWVVAWGRTPEIQALFFRGEDGLELLASE